MATELEAFEGSQEEKTTTEAIKFLKFTNFINLVMKSCNAMTSGSFSNAHIVLNSMYLEPLLKESMKRDFLNLEDMPSLEKPEYITIKAENLFNMELIETLSVHGIQGLTEECKPAFLALLTFFRNKEFHKEALSSLRTAGADKTKVAAIMAIHLLSPLIPGNDYILDKKSKNRPEECPCQLEKCKMNVRSGSTGLGSDVTWHGSADIILNHYIAVSILQSSSEGTEDEEGPSPSKPFCEEEGPPPSKRFCEEVEDSEEENDQSIKDNCDEEESTCCGNKSLLVTEVINQIIAETITNAFSQVNENEALTGRLIPTFGCNKDRVIVFLYDPKNDMLLQYIKEIPLWLEEGNILNVISIVQLWMFLNFTVFMRKDFADEYELHKSRFHVLVEDMLGKYRTLYPYSYVNRTDFCYENILNMMCEKSKNAVKRKK